MINHKHKEENQHKNLFSMTIENEKFHEIKIKFHNLIWEIICNFLIKKRSHFMLSCTFIAFKLYFFTIFSLVFNLHSSNQIFVCIIIIS